MAITTLTVLAPEEGTYAITCAFTDETAAAMTPNTLTWSLTDESGSVINSRSGVSIATPAASVTVVLSGDDLADVATTLKRRFGISGTYDSDLGSNLPLKAECKFTIDQFVTV